MGTTFKIILKTDPYHEPAGSIKGGRFASKQTGTPEFKAWFGDSKVVDGEGKPLVVYHGTLNKFSTFDESAQQGGTFGKGFYFSNSESLGREFSEGAEPMSVYLSLKNPYVVNLDASFEESLRQTSVFKKKGGKERLQAQGYDGVIAVEDGYMEAVAFKPEQIKSATGNSGKFDSKNKDITKAEIIRSLKGDPIHEPAGSPKGGQFAKINVSAEGWDAVQTTPVLKAGTKLIVYRVGTSPELKGVNGGNVYGIEAHILNWKEEGTIGDDINIYAHEVTLTKDTGEYEHIGFKGSSEENGTNPQVGRDQYFFGTGYSFPKDGAGFTSKLIKTIPVKDVLKEAEKDPDNAQRIATAITKVFSKTLAQVGETQKGDKEGHEFHGNQWTDHTGQTETPEFKAWFGDSKVVDKKGKPLVVYHGTNAEFTEFKANDSGELDLGGGIYFTNKDYRAKNYGGRVIPAYLSIKNPFLTTDETGLKKLGKYGQQGYKSKEIREQLISDGYDGVIDKDGNYVVFDNRQIKPAIGNSGKFDPKDSNITKMDFIKIMKGNTSGIVV